MTTTSSEATAVGGHRPTEVKGLKELKLNSEGGTKKEYEDFLKSIERVSDICNIHRHIKASKDIQRTS